VCKCACNATHESDECHKTSNDMSSHVKRPIREHTSRTPDAQRKEERVRGKKWNLEVAGIARPRRKNSKRERAALVGETVYLLRIEAHLAGAGASSHDLGARLTQVVGQRVYK